MPGPVTDTRAHALRARYHELFGGEELPVPVEAIAEDLLGLAVSEEELNGISGLLYPEERQIVVNASDVPARRRFTIAHELGHWVCQCLEGRTAPLYCRAEDVSEDADRSLEREANVFAAELLMPEPAMRSIWSDLKDVGATAERLSVSGTAAHWRLYSFNLLETDPTGRAG